MFGVLFCSVWRVGGGKTRGGEKGRRWKVVGFTIKFFYICDCLTQGDLAPALLLNIGWAGSLRCPRVCLVLLCQSANRSVLRVL